MRVGTVGLLGVLAATTVLSGADGAKAWTAGGTTDTVTLRLVIGKTPARVSIPNGDMARIGIRNEQLLGLIPSVGADRTTLTMVEITVDPVTAEERLRELGQLSLAIGEVVRFDGAVVPLEIELVQITPRTSRAPDLDGPCTRCCVFCEDIWVCGCRVETACGNCAARRPASVRPPRRQRRVPARRSRQPDP